MKANEISIKAPEKKPVKENFRPRVFMPYCEPQQEVEENACGVKVEPGHELHRIRNRLNSKLWDSIKRWD